MRIPVAWREPLEQERLLLLSPFEKKHRRMTADLADQRNTFVAAIADEVCFIHAAPGSKTESFAHANETHVMVLDSPANIEQKGSGLASRIIIPHLDEPSNFLIKEYII